MLENSGCGQADGITETFPAAVAASVRVQVQWELEKGAWPSWAEQCDPVQPCRTRLMYAMSLCAPQITRVDGKKLLLYREQFGKILQRTLHLTCKQGYILSCNLLHHLLRSATLIYPTEYCSVPGGFDKPLSEYFPIKARILIYLGLEDLTFFVCFILKNSCMLYGFNWRFLDNGSSNGKWCFGLWNREKMTNDLKYIDIK